MYCGPRTAEEKIICGAGWPRKESTWMVLIGGSPQSDQAHISELALAVVGSCWVLSAPDALRH